MTCMSYKGNMKFCLAKDGSIHQAPICDMVPKGYHHRPDNGLLWFKFRHSKNLFYLYFVMVLEVPGFNNMAWLFLFSIRFANTY